MAYLRTQGIQRNAVNDMEAVTVLDSKSESDLESEEVWPTSGTDSTAVFVSVLDRLKAPKVSDLSRKQEVHVDANLP